jgi:hypothetical protein
VSIFRCHVVESVFSQYCGHSSASGITRYIRFREPLLVEPETCRRAQMTDGNITIAGRIFRGNVGTTTSPSFFLAGRLDDVHHCSRETLWLGDGGKHDYQAAQTVLEITLTEEFAKINELTGKIRLPGDLVARAADKSIRDSIMGTMVWQYKSTTCPQGLTQLFRGLIRIYSNDTSNFVESVAILEDRGQVAGLELKETIFLCHLPAYKTHLRDIIMVIHPENFTSVVVDPFDPEHITDYIRSQSELSFCLSCM